MNVWREMRNARERGLCQMWYSGVPNGVGSYQGGEGVQFPHHRSEEWTKLYATNDYSLDGSYSRLRRPVEHLSRLCGSSGNKCGWNGFVLRGHIFMANPKVLRRWEVGRPYVGGVSDI
jgi:hypothetical protein